MNEEYKPYEVKNGKEYKVENKEEEVFAGKYYEEKVKNTDEIAIGLYDDPIRGPDKIASYPINSFYNGLLAVGNNRKTIVDVIMRQISKNHGATYIGKGCDWADDYVEISSNEINFEILDFKSDKNDKKFEEEIEEKMSKIRYMLNRTAGGMVTSAHDVFFNLIEEKLREDYDKLSINDLLEFVSNKDKFKEFARNNDVEFKKQVIYRFSRIAKGTLDMVSDENKISISECINNKDLVVLDIEGENPSKELSIISNLLIKEVFDSKKEKTKTPHFLAINDTVKNIELNTNFFNKIAPKSRKYKLGLIVSEREFGDIEDIDKNLASIFRSEFQSFIIGQINSESEAAKAGQVYDRGGKEIRELENDEVLLKPITSKGFISEIVLKTRIFPKFKPGTFN